MIVVVLGTAAGFWLARDLGVGNEGLAGMLGCLLGYVSGGVLGRFLHRAVGVVEQRVERLPPAQVVAGSVGALGGALAGAVLAGPLLAVLPVRIALTIGALIVWIAAFVGFRVIGGRSAAMLELLGLSTRPLVRAQAFDARDGLLVDTSVLMDGQLAAVATTGLLGGDLMVARFVLDELQGFADGVDDTDPADPADPARSPAATRARRAHRALETLDHLRRVGPMRVLVVDDEVPEHSGVDAKLAALARRLQLRLLTNDAALARVAEIQGVPTVNLRRLAADLAPAIVPGDQVRVALTRPGRQRDQGVGHLDDGSMVVVNGGANLVGGPELPLRVTSVVPTAAGRVVFAAVEAGVAP